jgi:hypothetical protein
MFRQHLQQNSKFSEQNLSQYQFVYYKFCVEFLGIEPGSQRVWSNIKHMRRT